MHSYITDITTPSLFQCSSVLTEREIGKRSHKYSLLKKSQLFLLSYPQQKWIIVHHSGCFPCQWKGVAFDILSQISSFSFQSFQMVSPILQHHFGFIPSCLLGFFTLILSTNKSTVLAVLKFSLLMEKLRTCMFHAFLMWWKIIDTLRGISQLSTIMSISYGPYFLVRDQRHRS